MKAGGFKAQGPTKLHSEFKASLSKLVSLCLKTVKKQQQQKRFGSVSKKSAYKLEALSKESQNLSVPDTVMYICNPSSTVERWEIETEASLEAWGWGPLAWHTQLQKNRLCFK